MCGYIDERRYEIVCENIPGEILNVQSQNVIRDDRAHPSAYEDERFRYLTAPEHVQNGELGRVRLQGFGGHVLENLPDVVRLFATQRPAICASDLKKDPLSLVDFEVVDQPS